MLGIIICYSCFYEFLFYQLANLERYVKVPYRVYVIDNGNESNIEKLSVSRFPFVYIRNPVINTSPSHRHQDSVNLGLQIAWKDCDSFLFLDNDMVLMTELKEEPKEDLSYTPTFRGKWDYCWLNLLYMKKFLSQPFVFNFYKCPKTGEGTDSGGNTGLLLQIPELTKSKIEYTPSKEYLENYIERYEKLCKEFSVPFEFEVYKIQKTVVFHFTKISNYCNYPDIFMSKKKELILETVKKYC